MLDVRRLRVFKEVAERGSFSGAAEALSYTQSAVSQQIAALERETGTTLLHRGAGGIRLTDAGRALTAHADAVLARLEDAEQELAAIAGLRGGRLRLASFPSAGATLVTEAVSLFTTRYPDVELRLAEREPEDSVPSLKRGEFDLAVVFEYSNSPAGSELLQGLDCIHLLDDPVYAVLPVDHRLANRKSIRLAELENESWVGGCLGGVCCSMLHDWCSEAGFQPNLTVESNDHNVQMGLVAAGIGVTLLPELALRIAHPGVAVRQIAKPRPVRHIFAAAATDGYRSPATEAMIDVLQTVSKGFAQTPRAAA
jgi:DNA-binding transcriptional LysR family regulator